MFLRKQFAIKSWCNLADNLKLPHPLGKVCAKQSIWRLVGIVFVNCVLTVQDL